MFVGRTQEPALSSCKREKEPELTCNENVVVVVGSSLRFNGVQQEIHGTLLKHIQQNCGTGAVALNCCCWCCKLRRSDVGIPTTGQLTLGDSYSVANTNRKKALIGV